MYTHTSEKAQGKEKGRDKYMTKAREKHLYNRTQTSELANNQVKWQTF